MPSESDGRAWADILDNALLARQWLGDMDATAFAEDRRTFYAVTRALEIISESARRLSDAERARHDLPWRPIMGAGNIYRHQYDNVDEQLVWRSVRNDLEPLITAARASLP